MTEMPDLWSKQVPIEYIQGDFFTVADITDTDILFMNST
jgi:hypothetical protein